MLMNPCIDISKKEQETEKKLNVLRNLFDGRSVTDIDGKIVEAGSSLSDAYGRSDSGFGDLMFKELVWKSTYKTIEAAESFSDADFRRITSEIVKESRGLRDPSLSFLEKHMFVKRGVMGKHRVTNWFNNMINTVTNFERVRNIQFVHRNREISKILRQEVIRRKGQHIAFMGIKAEKQLDKLENKLFEVLHDIAHAKKNKNDTLELDKKANNVRAEILKVLESEGGSVLFDFVQYMNTSPDSDGAVRRPQGSEEGAGTLYPRAIIEAGRQARSMLNEMGDVYVKGLKRHKSVVNLAFLNSSTVGSKERVTPLGQRVDRYHKRVDEQIKAIRDGMKDGNYFPHYLMEAMVGIEKEMEIIDSKMKDMKDNWSESEATPHLEKLESMFSKMRNEINRSPVSTQHRKKLAYDTWIKNPMAVLKKYGLDAIAFNKNQHLKYYYQRAMKHMPKEGEAAHAMSKYLQDVYTLAERGFIDRPQWVNRTVRLLTGYEFLSKIGFGVGTAARNTMSGLWFVQGLGNMKFAKYMNAWHNKVNEELVEKIKIVEQEQGFKFEDMAEELYTEGLVPTKGVRTSDIDMVVDKDGKPSFSYKEGKLWRSVDSGLAYAAGKGAIFQRVTENFLRRHMFRSSLLTKYKELESAGVKDPMEASKAYALNMVNKYAFEYAAHQKAPFVGGTPGKLGAAGQVMFQFFHYPTSFLQSQSEILRNSKDAAIARQWDNPDLLIPVRFAGLAMVTALWSGIRNRDFTRLMENDTIDRIKNLYEVLMGDDEDVKGRGYIGPAVGDLVFLATLHELVQMPDNDFVDLIVGYNDAYKLTDEQKTQRLWSTLNVEASKIINKTIPALMSGRESNMLMHERGTYPRAWTKELHKKIWGKHSKLSKKSTKKKTRVTPPYAAIKELPKITTKIPTLKQRARSEAVKALKTIPSPVPGGTYDDFDKRNLLDAIDMIRRQQREEEEIYRAENNRRMVVT